MSCEHYPADDGLDRFLAEEYRFLHSRGAFQGTTIRRHVGSLLPIFERHGVKTALDYGCGKAGPYKDGTMARLFPGVSFSLYDAYVAEFEKLTDLKVDCVLLCDVLEHLPAHRFEPIFRSIFKRATRCVIATFCNRPARKRFRDGRNVHISLHNKGQWGAIIDPFNKDWIPLYLFETP